MVAGKGIPVVGYGDELFVLLEGDKTALSARCPVMLQVIGAKQQASKANLAIMIAFV